MSHFYPSFVLAAGLFFGPRAQAHDVAAEVTPIEGALRIQFFFSDGTPAADFAVSVTYPGEPPQTLGQTDTQGQFIFRPDRLAACTVKARQAGHGTNVAIPLTVLERIMDKSSVYSDEEAGALDTANQPGPSERRRTRFPWMEVLVSVGFVVVLSVISMVLLRLTGRQERTIMKDYDVLLRENETMRRELQHLREDRERA